MTLYTEQLKKILHRLDGAYAPNSIRAYKTDMEEFIEYCAMIDQEPLPANPSVVSDYIATFISSGLKSASIRRKASSISAIHRLSGLPDPTKSPEVTLALRKVYRQLGCRSAQAYGIRLEDLEAMLASTGPDIRGARDRALLLLGYDTMRRRSELVSLRIEDIYWRADGSASILLRRSKTDQASLGKTLSISKRTGQAISEWLISANIENGFILRSIHPNLLPGENLSDGHLARILKRIATRSGVEERIVRRISGHSLRVGAAQEMVSMGATLPQIMVCGG